MSRITGNDVANLMEAYSTVYAPQEVNEEQVWEEVENWVNSLVEEGYDLSEYTWEDMYEAYLDEIVRPTTGQMTAPKRDQAQTAARPAPQATRPAGGGMGGMRGTGRNRNATQTSSSPGALRVPARPQQGPTDRPGLMPGLSVGPGGFNINNRPVQTTPARPAAPAPARPAAQAPARSAAPAPARPAAPATTARPTATPATTTTPATTPAAPQRTFNPLMQRTFGYQTGYAPSQVKQDPKKMAQMGTLRSISSSFDPFDIVQGYLIDEGYAETKEAAAVIMANMSEEWKTQILESGYFPTKESQREDEAKYKKGGSEVKHRTAQTQARPTPSK
jgi:hypothetical protein